MTKHVPVAAFKDRVSEYVAEAETGGEIIITRHGKAAARLIPATDDKEALRLAAVSKMRSVRDRLKREGVRVLDTEIRSMLEADRP